MSLLTFIMGLPLIMAMILTLVPADKRAVFRWGAMLSTLASMLLAIYVFAQPSRPRGMRRMRSTRSLSRNTATPSRSTRRGFVR